MPRRARLARRADLDACWTEGRRIPGRFVDVAWRPTARTYPRFAVIVSRFQHSAVARNRVRRRLRETMRRRGLAKLAGVDVVVRARRSAYGASFPALQADVTAVLARVP